MLLRRQCFDNAATNNFAVGNAVVLVAVAAVDDAVPAVPCISL